MRFKEAEGILAASAEWKEKCFLKGGSLFCDESLWALEHFQELKRCFVDNPLEDSRPFLEKLREQLGPASAQAKRLWAEMEWLINLIVSSLKRETKLDKIKTLWEWSGMVLPDSTHFLGEVLEGGTVNPGYGFHSNKWREMAFMIECMLVWYTLTDDEQNMLVNQPWEFADWLDSLPNSSSRLFRHTLLFLLFPDEFEDILSTNHKRQIVRSFNKKFGFDGNVDEKPLRELDQDLLRVRERVNQENPEIEVEFYSSRFKKVWQDGSKDEKPRSENSKWISDKFGEAEIWLLAPGEQARLWTDFLNSGIAAIGWDQLGDLKEYGGKEEIQNQLQKFDLGGEGMIWDFYQTMKVDDVVIAKRGRSEILGYGRVTGDYVYEDDRLEYRNTRPIDWYESKEPIKLEKKIAIRTLSRVDKNADWLKLVVESIDGSLPIGSSLETSSVPDSYDLSEALKDVFLEHSQLQQILDALALRKNLVLQGPPGVGKTFIAKRIAWLLFGVKDSTRVGMVQFHQSYSYEDFVQGWRPTAEGGFELKNGVFYEFCKRAEQHLDQSFVFIIDELNRGNLSRIFGELLMLIEADKRGQEHAISLTYGDAGETFSVPENVHILGLMNTADRSLAIVDYALRRRFAFETLKPAFGGSQFREYLIEADVDRDLVTKVETRLRELNKKIEDDKDLGAGFVIGHSYFVPESNADSHWYQMIIETQIRPLLQEYWFDHPDKVEEAVQALLV